MLSHHEIWNAIDRLAERNGMSASALARRSGLDPTTFNKSKRVTRDGKRRWPSTESLSKVLAATETPLDDFVALVAPGDGSGPTRDLPVRLLNGRSNGSAPARETITVATLTDPQAYALRVDGDALWPIYREGDLLVVSPGATLRPGDRVVARTATGTQHVALLEGWSGSTARLGGLGGAPVPSDEPITVHRIVWASQ